MSLITKEMVLAFQDIYPSGLGATESETLNLYSLSSFGATDTFAAPIAWTNTRKLPADQEWKAAANIYATVETIEIDVFDDGSHAVLPKAGDYWLDADNVGWKIHDIRVRAASAVLSTLCTRKEV